MSSTRQTIITILFLMISFNVSALSITTFNVKIFGLGGHFSGEIGDEYRDNWLKEFVANNLNDSDVITFQEIVDVSRLKNMLFPEYQCVSYDTLESVSRKHQHIVLCYKTSKYYFANFYNDNYIIEEVALIKYRPALYGVLMDLKGNAVADIVSLHLKASPSGKEKRLRQAKILKDFLKGKRHKGYRPLIITGDFNTFNNDVEELSNVFNELEIKHVDNDLWTYRVWKYQNQFDHFWVSNNALEKIKSIKVSGPCNNQQGYFSRYQDVGFYNTFISDHCPVTLDISI